MRAGFFREAAKRASRASKRIVSVRMAGQYRMNWQSDSGDPSVALFTAFTTRFGFDLAPDAKVLELGCCETEFLEAVHRQNPAMSLVGLDWRQEGQRAKDGWVFVQADACRRDLQMPGYFDAVIALGAIEHFGLGYYGDPLHDDAGDVLAARNAAYWLKPGGVFYCDVPCNPTGWITENRHFRIYSPQDVSQRLMAGFREVARGYTWHDPVTVWVDEPVTMRVPYYYCAVKGVKAWA